jgi:16S rRNA U1498 N3-methylase RsmE
LRVSLDQPPPAKLPLTLVLALPRPKMLRRVFQTVATMGVPKVMLVNSYRSRRASGRRRSWSPKRFASN